jgi:hypothetical protein
MFQLCGFVGSAPAFPGSGQNSRRVIAAPAMIVDSGSLANCGLMKGTVSWFLSMIAAISCGEENPAKGSGRTAARSLDRRPGDPAGELRAVPPGCISPDGKSVICPPGIHADDDAPRVHWVAAESLEAALGYMRRRYDDFIIVEARFLGMIPLLSGSPLD